MRYAVPLSILIALLAYLALGKADADMTPTLSPSGSATTVEVHDVQGLSRQDRAYRVFD